MIKPNVTYFFINLIISGKSHPLTSYAEIAKIFKFNLFSTGEYCKIHIIFVTL